MTRRAPEHDVVEIEFHRGPKCFICGNSRVFYVESGGTGLGLWTVTEPFPAGSRVVSCGKCRSRHSIIRDYAD